jgi:hypothetical protein
LLTSLGLKFVAEVGRRGGRKSVAFGCLLAVDSLTQFDQSVWNAFESEFLCPSKL